MEKILEDYPNSTGSQKLRKLALFKNMGICKREINKKLFKQFFDFDNGLDEFSKDK